MMVIQLLDFHLEAERRKPCENNGGAGCAGPPGSSVPCFGEEDPAVHHGGVTDPRTQSPEACPMPLIS